MSVEREARFGSKFEFVLDFELRFQFNEKVLMNLQMILNLLFSGIFVTVLKHMISFLKQFDK